MDRTTTALMTGGLSEIGGGLFGGGDDDAMEDMIRLIKRNTEAAENDYKPYLGGGRRAQDQLMAQLGLGGGRNRFDVTKLPGYQQALTQGLSAVNQGAAGAGMLMSGERLKGLQDVGHNIFGDYYNNYMNRLTGMASQGMSAAGNLANIRSAGTGQQLGIMQTDQQNKSAMMSDLMGLIGTGAGMMVGGPAGGAIGGTVGRQIGGSGGDFNMNSLYRGF